MKKLNNKGMTLVELIVSFAIVTVAVVYFAQSLVTVTKIYRNAEKETNEFVNEAYYLRLLDNYYKNAIDIAKADANKEFFRFDSSDSSKLSASSNTWITLKNNPLNNPYITVTNFFKRVINTYNPKQKLFKSKGCLNYSCTKHYTYYAYLDHTKYDIDYSNYVIKLK